MKIALIEPLGISEEKLASLAGMLTDRSHEFAAYDSFSADPEELIRRTKDADVVMLANHPLPAAVIEASEKLKFISVAFVGIDHVDAAALAEALNADRICAGIDVYEADPPLPAEHPLMGARNLACTPHVGFDARESIDRRAVMAFENVTAWEDGRPVRLML